MKQKRVVITGLGVVSPNGVGLPDFLQGLREGRSGIRFIQNLKDLGFSCCIAGKPEVTEEMKLKYLSAAAIEKFQQLGYSLRMHGGYRCLEGCRVGD